MVLTKLNLKRAKPSIGAHVVDLRISPNATALTKDQTLSPLSTRGSLKKPKPGTCAVVR